MHLKTNFETFAQRIQLDSNSNKKQLTQKREQLVTAIRRYIGEEGLPQLQKVYNQGSYAVGTGVKPVKGRDFDIDVALVFNIKKKNYKDPVEPKKWVYNALKRYGGLTPNQVEILPACVRVHYKKYHVDFAVYGLDDNGNKYIAKGQKGSQHNNKKWETSYSEKLKEKLKKPKLEGKARAQYCRLIRYLKRWKDVQFKVKTNEAPTGIALSVLVYNWFQPQFFKNGQPNDLKALEVVLSQSRKHNDGLFIKLPVTPNNKLFEDINESHNHKAKYIKKMKALHQAVKQARATTNEKVAAQFLRTQLGDDFPI